MAVRPIEYCGLFLPAAGWLLIQLMRVVAEAESRWYPSKENAMMSNDHRREVLPGTRDSVTHKFSINGYEAYLTIGLFEDGRPGEIFMKISKEGSTLSGLIQGFCRSFSIALQYGLSIEDAVARFKGMRFDPAGPTSNAQIPHASSILDYVARFLELEYGEDARGDAA